MKKKYIIISGINFFEGGPLSIIFDCLSFLNDSEYVRKYNIVALVHKINLYDQIKFNNIEFIEFPKSRASYIYRLYYEYFYFKKFAKNKNIKFWLSLHDMTPSLQNIPQAVYCHNPSPFSKVILKDFLDQPQHFFFTLFYKYLYKINIKKNDFVIVQQQWIKKEFVKMFSLYPNKIIVAPPNTEGNLKYFNQMVHRKNEFSINKVFFYPTLSRPFKNIEVICEAAKLLIKEEIINFNIIITIDGSENNYAKRIVNTFKDVDQIKFIGRISRKEVYEIYDLADCLLFPSKLETWGLPLSEFKQFKKPIFVSDLPYAKETVGDYELVKYFNPDSSKILSKFIKNFLNNSIVYDQSYNINLEQPVVENWEKLFLLILK